MQLQNFPPEPRRDTTLEHIESRAASPRETATLMQREADQRITDAKSGIERAREEMRGSNTDPAMLAELQRQEKELDAAWDELLQETNRVTATDSLPAPLESETRLRTKKDESELDWETPAPVEGESILEDETVLVSKAKEVIEASGSSRADELFEPSENTSEQIPGFDQVAFAKNLILFRARYGEALFATTVASYLPKNELAEFVEIMATTDAPPLPEDFKSLGEPIVFESEAKTFLHTYKLIRPGTKQEKIDLLQTLEKSDDPSKEIRIMNEEVLEGRPHPGDRFLKVKNIAIEKDDAEFALIQEAKAELPLTATGESIFNMEQSLSGKTVDTHRFFSSVEIAADHPFNAEERAKAEHIAMAVKSWLDSVTDDPRLTEVAAAQALTIHHEQFNKDRTIPPFMNLLKRKLSGPIMGFILQEIRHSDQTSNVAAENVVAKAQQLFDAANTLFIDVQTNGMPGFKAFSHWLEEKAMAQYDETKGETKKGTLKEGEFHIGRDTLTTTYVARMASQWGKMSGAERKRAIKHVDVSRVLLDTVPRAVLADFLKQNKLNDKMIGLDGGYRGTGPQDVLLALMTPERRAQMMKTENENVLSGLDEQVKLLSANPNAKARGFDPTEQFSSVVGWMETLPKFTERSQQLVKTGAGDYAKYLIVTQEKDASEQMMAWVVQHAVWRGMMTPELAAAPDATEEELDWAA